MKHIVFIVLIAIAGMLTSCNPPRDANGDYFKTMQFKKRIFANQCHDCLMPKPIIVKK